MGRRSNTEADFWAKVDKRGPDDCWEWMGWRIKAGYGYWSFKDKDKRAHRMAWLFSAGKDAGELCVLHSCDNPPCCNPKHLFLGTNADNTKDAVAKGRMATGERHGSRTHPERILRGDMHPAKLHPDRVVKGERIGSAKLTDSKVREIRASTKTCNVLAVEFGVSRSTISRVKRIEIWGHVE